MFNWFDLMRQAQVSAGLNALTRQFQLSGDQPEKIMAAFAPAFALGLQHAMLTNDPTRFLQTMTSSAYQNLWQAAGFSFSPQAHQEGHRLLDQLFGSDEVSRRVAHQAASYAGISADTMQQLLPILAGILAGGVSQWMMAHAQGLSSYAIEQRKEKQTSPLPWADLWGQWLSAPEPEKKPATPFDELMAAFLPPPAPKPPEPQAAAPSWDEMMEKGREMQVQYLTSLQSILSEAWRTEPKKA